MTELDITVDDFILNFPEFDGVENISLSPVNYGKLSDESRKLAIYLFAAHLLALQKSIKEGNTSVNMTASASIDKVSVSMVPPPSLGAFEYWLNQTQYGAELLALLSVVLPIPLLLGGSFVRTLL